MDANLSNRKIFSSRLALFIICVITMSMIATDAADAQRVKRRAGANNSASIERRVERLDKALTLTETQKAEITTILEDAAQKRIEIRKENKEDKEKRRELIRELDTSITTDIMATLDDEQKQKFEEMQNKRRERRSNNK